MSPDIVVVGTFRVNTTYLFACIPDFLNCHRIRYVQRLPKLGGSQGGPEILKLIDCATRLDHVPYKQNLNPKGMLIMSHIENYRLFAEYHQDR